MFPSPIVLMPTALLRARSLLPSLPSNVSSSYTNILSCANLFVNPACFGFLLSFYTNVWVEKGYALAYGEMAAVSGGCLLFSIPMYIWGKQMRVASMKWKVVQFISWDDDREVGE